MSGGSFNYIHVKNPDELIEYLDDVKAMRDMLNEMGYEDVSVATGQVVELIEDFTHKTQKAIDQLRAIWKAVEYFDSGDWSREEIILEVGQWRMNMKRKAGEVKQPKVFAYYENQRLFDDNYHRPAQRTDSEDAASLWKESVHRNFKLVAFIECETLEDCFSATQNDVLVWKLNNNVKPINYSSARSSCVGDVFVDLERLEAHVVKGSGFGII